MKIEPNQLKGEEQLITGTVAVQTQKTSSESKERAERKISDLVGTFTDPIIVMPGGWGETLPDWIKEAVTLERLLENTRPPKGEEPKGTDAEVVAYLYTASLEASLDSNWAQIYLYLAGKEIAQHRKTEVPADIKVESLSHDQINELNRLKEWIYATRVRARRDKDRAENRERKEQDKQKKEELQPRMFDF